MNPRPPECKSDTTPTVSYNLPLNWKDFEAWVFNTHRPKTAVELVRYAKKFAYILENPEHACQLTMLTKDVRRAVMSSLSNLSKYLGCYQYWKQIIKNNGLKWENRNGIEAFRSMLNTNIEDVKTWLKDVVSGLPKEYAVVLVFDALSGLRPNEAVMSCNLIAELTETNRLSQYYESELSMLQHFRYPKLFLRRTKNAYISFVSKELLNLVVSIKPKINYPALDTRIGRLGLKVQVNMLRKLHGTLLRDYGIPKELIDLLHGRISQSIFVKFYYKPVLKQLRDKTLNAIKPFETELLAR